MPRGYFFGEFEITDSAAYETYRTEVPNIISAHKGRILVRGGDPQPFDGPIPTGFLQKPLASLLNFPSLRLSPKSAHG
jgi:uncharacterized protein (DUF1330 family)